MPAMQGSDEQEAIRLSLEFMGELAQKLQKHHLLYYFRGGVIKLDSATPPSLADPFKIEIRAFWSRKWNTFATFGFWRADWDDTPEMRSAVCTTYRQDLLPAFFKTEVKRFVDCTFGCKRVRFFSTDEVDDLMKRK